MTNKKTFQVAEGVSHVCNDADVLRKMSSDWPILTKLRCKLQRGCYTQVTCLATLRKVEGRSTFLATRNATIAVAKWGVTREFFLATCNATMVSLQVARKIASCNMALSVLKIPIVPADSMSKLLRQKCFVFRASCHC